VTARRTTVEATGVNAATHSHAPKAPRALSPRLTVADVADYLGFAQRTVREMFENGELPGFQLRKRWRMRESALAALLARKEAEHSEAAEHAVRALRGLHSSSRRLVVPPRPGVSPT
jgi:excisionase family DNA binding protein